MNARQKAATADGSAAFERGSVEEAREANSRLLLAALDANQTSQDSMRERTQLQMLLEGLAEGVIVLDGSGAVRFMNSSAKRTTGLTADHLDGGHVRRLQRTDGSPLDAGDWPTSRAIRGEQFVDEEVAVVTDAQVRRVVFSGNCLKGLDDRVRVAIVTCRDITEFRQLEEMREEDTALISHDLRNPLAIITAAAHRLRRDAAAQGTDEIRELGDLISANAQRMLEMIEELVEAAYLESRNTALAHEPVSFGPLVKRIVGQLGEGDRIRVTMRGEAASVAGDRQRIERLVTNLIGNALKYSAPGSPVEVDIDTREAEIVVSVHDQGKGIPPGELPHLFERFYRIKRPAGIKGNGLGLYIASLVVQAHGGWIRATSEEGMGSTFSFGLPREDVE